MRDDGGMSLPLLSAGGGGDGIDHFFTLRLRSPKDLPLRQALPENRGKFLVARQVHGDSVLGLDHPVPSWEELAKTVSETACDALITNQAGMGVAVVTADCLPILLYDPDRRVVGAVHAGWRGTIQRVLAKAVSRMVGAFRCRPEHIRAGIGPSIGPCCYVVGEAVTRPLEESFEDWASCYVPDAPGKGRLDLRELNRRQLLREGIPPKNIQTMDLCTACHPDRFTSYRREGVRAGRMISGIVLRLEKSHDPLGR